MADVNVEPVFIKPVGRMDENGNLVFQVTSLEIGEPIALSHNPQAVYLSRLTGWRYWLACLLRRPTLTMVTADKVRVSVMMAVDDDGQVVGYGGGDA